MTPPRPAPRLDRAPGAPETRPSRKRGGAATPAAADLRQTAAQPSPANDAAPSDLMAKAEAVAGKLAALKADVAAANELAHRSQVGEALTRAELTLALTEALAARAQAEARYREAVAARGFAQLAKTVRPRRRGPFSRRLEKLLGRLGSFGQAVILSRSGLWRGTGRALFDLRHMAAYARRGANPGVQPPALFDQGGYLAAHPDVFAARRAPLLHYLTSGGAEGRDPHPLFDAAWYRRRNEADLAGTGLTPLEHYVRVGAARGADPHPLFSIAHYLSQDPQLAAGEDPLSHYLRTGWMEGLSPHPLFDPRWYRARAPRTAAGHPPLVHYLAEGWRNGTSPHPLFDPAWYLEQYADVASAGLEPLSHFVAIGAAEGRSPGPWFDLPHYVAIRGEALSGEANPLVDYLQGGAWSVGEPRPGFATTAYLASRPELAREGLTPLEHWARQASR